MPKKDFLGLTFCWTLECPCKDCTFSFIERLTPLSHSLSLSFSTLSSLCHEYINWIVSGWRRERRSNPFLLFWRRGRKMVSLSRGEKKISFSAPMTTQRHHGQEKKGGGWERLYKSALEYWHWKIRRKKWTLLYLRLHILQFCFFAQFHLFATATLVKTAAVWLEIKGRGISGFFFSAALFAKPREGSPAKKKPALTHSLASGWRRRRGGEGRPKSFHIIIFIILPSHCGGALQVFLQHNHSRALV